MYFLFLIVYLGDNTAKFSSDFENFLNDLGSMVYKSKKSAKNDNPIRQSTTVKPAKQWGKENIRNTQKEVIGDMLMMKLVSYYEDKYKLNHERDSDHRMTEKITADPFPLNRYNEIERTDMRASSYNRNRRYNVPNSRRNYEDPNEVQDVVVL